MIRHLANCLLPASFIRRFRPVKSHPHEKALGGHFFDANAVRFFIGMATADAVSPDAVWTVAPPPAGSGLCRVVNGQREQIALGYVICQVPFAAGEHLEFEVCRKLTYRARVRLATLQSLLADLHQAGQPATGSDLAAFIQRRIEEFKA